MASKRLEIRGGWPSVEWEAGASEAECKSPVSFQIFNLMFQFSQVYGTSLNTQNQIHFHFIIVMITAVISC